MSSTSRHPIRTVAAAGLLLALIGAAPAEPFRIGLLSAGPDGADVLLRGARSAAAEINRDGGIGGRRVEMVALPPATEAWRDAAAEIARLVFEKHVGVLVGPADGTGSHVAAQIATRARVPLITLSAESSLTKAGSPWVFQAVPDDRAQVQALLDAAFTSPRGQRATVIVPSGRAGREKLRALQSACAEIGVQLTAVIEVATHVAAQPIALPDSDVLMLWLVVDAALTWLDTVEIGTMPATILAPATLNNARFGTHFGAWRRGQSDWDGRFFTPSVGTDTEDRERLIREITFLIARAARQAGSSPDRLRRALADGASYTGRTESLAFDLHGDRRGAPTVGVNRER